MTFFSPLFSLVPPSEYTTMFSPLPPTPSFSFLLCHLVLDLSAKGVWKPAFLEDIRGWGAGGLPTECTDCHLSLPVQ